MTSQDSVTIPFLIWLFVVMPAYAFRAWRRLKSGKPLPPKKTRYLAVIISQLFLVGMTFIAAKRNGFALSASIAPPWWACLIAGAYLGIIGFRVKQGWQKMPQS